MKCWPRWVAKSLMSLRRRKVQTGPLGPTGSARTAARRRSRRAREKNAPVRLLTKSGWVLGGEIARLVDRGYQKFFKTSKLEIPATADHLRALHSFEEQLKEAVGSMVLYNEALGTTSDQYDYDRLKGR